MVHRKWTFLSNPFLVEGSRNFKKAYDLARYTDAALNARTADAFFAALYATFHPLFVTLDSEYNDWQSQGGIQQGSTLSLDQLLTALGTGDTDLGITSRINEWDVAVQNVFAKGTPSYKAVFPNGRAPFQSGSKNSRIAAVSTLSDTLATFPALAPVKAMVDAFLTSLNTARLAQQGQISSTVTDSDEVRAAVEAAMIGMFAVYGGLIQHFAATPDDVEAFFDLELLRSLPQTEFTVTVAGGESKFIVKRTLEPDRLLKLTNLSASEFKVYSASEKNDGPGDGGVIVPGNEDITVTWQALKQSPDATYLKAHNNNPSAEGHLRIEILPEGDE